MFVCFSMKTCCVLKSSQGDFLKQNVICIFSVYKYIEICNKPGPAELGYANSVDPDQLEEWEIPHDLKACVQTVWHSTE